MKQIILLALTLLTYSGASAQAEWLLGHGVYSDSKYVIDSIIRDKN